MATVPRARPPWSPGRPSRSGKHGYRFARYQGAAVEPQPSEEDSSEARDSLPKLQERVMKDHGRGTSRTRMAAASGPLLPHAAGRAKLFVATILPSQEPVDSAHGAADIPRLDVPGHEPGRVAASVLAINESVDAADDIPPAESGVVSRDAFALDDRVRFVAVEFLEKGREVEGDVGAAVRCEDIGGGSSFGPARDEHPWSPPSESRLDRIPHAVT